MDEREIAEVETQELRLPNRFRGLLVVTFLPVIWGTTFPAMKLALREVSPMAFSVLRFGMTTLGFLFCSKHARRGLRILIRPQGPAERLILRDSLVLGGTLAAGYILQVLGLMTTSVSKSAFLTSTAVLWTPMFSLALGRDRFSWYLISAVLLTLFGIILLMHPFGVGEGFVVGDFLTLGCAFSFSIYILWVDRAAPHAMAVVSDLEKSPHSLASIIVTSNQLIVATLIMATLLPFETIKLPMTPVPLIAGVYTAIFATAMTAYLQSRYQNAVSPATASVIYMLEPVVAAILGYFFLMERMGTEELLGALFIVMGVLVAQFQSLWKSLTPSAA